MSSISRWVVWVGLCGGLTALAQVPRQINYQGRLVNGTNLVNGPVTAAFRLYTVPVGGAALFGQTGSVSVVDGLYAVALGDGTPGFGALFTNQPLYLEVGINGVDLAPRERVQSAAYALRADGVSTGAITSAMIAAGAVGGAQLGTGSVTSAKLAAGAVGAAQLATGSVGAAALQAGAVTPDKLSERYWSVSGNTDAVAGVNFLGTVNAQAFDLRVFNARVMRFQPSGGFPNPSIIGGHATNWVKDLVFSAVVAGGGETGQANRVTDDFGAVGGGRGNQAGNDNVDYADVLAATVAGGEGNQAGGPHAAVGGGRANTAYGEFAVVAGGYSNQATTDATVGGGWGNRASGSGSVVAGGVVNTSAASHTVVGGGQANRAGEDYAVVAGGFQNHVGSMWGAAGGGRYNEVSGLFDGVVAGGLSNRVDGQACAVGGGAFNAALDEYAVVGGGLRNLAWGGESVVGGGFSNAASGSGSVVAGGYENSADGSSSIVGGGSLNEASQQGGVVVGGWNNVAAELFGAVLGGRGNANDAMFGTLGGGFFNRIYEEAQYGVVGGGYSNRVVGTRGALLGGMFNTVGGDYGLVGGGYSNYAGGSAAVVAGGRENDAGSDAAVGGGSRNSASGSNATIPGGFDNRAAASWSLAAGYRATVDSLDDGTFLWSDRSSTSRFYSAAANEFGIRAASGVRLALNSPGPGYNRQVGRMYRDNTILAWGKVAADGTAGDNTFGVALTTNQAVGFYEIQLRVEATNAAQLVMVATPEIDGQPASAAAARIVSVDQRTATNFYIYINNGAFTPVDNDFTFMVTGR